MGNGFSIFKFTQPANLNGTTGRSGRAKYQLWLTVYCGLFGLGLFLELKIENTWLVGFIAAAPVE